MTHRRAFLLLGITALLGLLLAVLLLWTWGPGPQDPPALVMAYASHPDGELGGSAMVWKVQEHTEITVVVRTRDFDVQEQFYPPLDLAIAEPDLSPEARAQLEDWRDEPEREREEFEAFLCSADDALAESSGLLRSLEER